MKRLWLRFYEWWNGPVCPHCRTRHENGSWKHLDRSLRCYLARARAYRKAEQARVDRDRVPKRLLPPPLASPPEEP